MVTRGGDRWRLSTTTKRNNYSQRTDLLRLSFTPSSRSSTTLALTPLRTWPLQLSTYRRLCIRSCCPPGESRHLATWAPNSLSTSSPASCFIFTCPAWLGLARSPSQSLVFRPWPAWGIYYGTIRGLLIPAYSKRAHSHNPLSLWPSSQKSKGKLKQTCLKSRILSKTSFGRGRLCSGQLGSRCSR